MIFSGLHRHQFGLLVASLTKKIGLSHIVLIEDAVQYASEQALLQWSRGETPENQLGWLYRVAYRHTVKEIKALKRRQVFLESNVASEFESEPFIDEPAFDNELTDSFLKVLFSVCDDKLAVESQLVFTLKSLCGFDTNALSIRLFTSEANVYKRYQRAKSYLASHYVQFDSLSEKLLIERLPNVLKVIYLMFTEGYLSSHVDQAIRRDLCDEALRIIHILLNTELGRVPQSFALAALIHFNISRISARENEVGLILLEHQNRALWDKEHIQQGMNLLSLSAQGDDVSRYHIEAGIAAEHCMAPSYAETNWGNIVASYTLLEKIAPSPMNLLAKAIALAETQSPEIALETIKREEAPNWLICSYYWFAVLADLQYQCGKINEANSNASRALELAKSSHVCELLKKRFNKYKN